VVQGQPGQKVSENLLQPKKKLGMMLHFCNPSHAGGIGRRIIVQAWPRQKIMYQFSEKTTKAERTGNIAQITYIEPVT
jgi:hypothetical protein